MELQRKRQWPLQQTVQFIILHKSHNQRFGALPQNISISLGGAETEAF